MDNHWPPDPPIARPGSELAREIYPEPRAYCGKCDRRLPESQTVPNDLREPWWRTCLDCRREEQADG